MGLCKLAVIDYENSRQNIPLEFYPDGWHHWDIWCWIEYIEDELSRGITKNWWYGFRNKNFLKFLRKYAIKQREINS